MARTNTSARWQRVQTLSAPSPASPPAGTSPIYEQLAREWAAAGRTLPGRPDLEWTRLSRYPPPGSEADILPDPPPPRRGWLHEPHLASNSFATQGGSAH
ncbi:hypothetical protein [Streptomyces sp.]|uniref:hypothetical protein n=1 Tax=Streptomyces sp. TaxID=1931 RepID=UPI002D765DE7|nr:hypothetical protein [Streptomyces sp.]HET6354958.1 hypothetical protein [Streptomyces sp.]